MKDENFLQKFKGRFETIGKEGIIDIMKIPHIEINNDALSNYTIYSTSKIRTKP